MRRLVASASRYRQRKATEQRTSTASATSTSMSSISDLAPFVAAVLRDQVVADLQAENTELKEELAGIEGLLSLVNDINNMDDPHTRCR